MKHLLRVPVDTYAFIEEEFEGTAEEAFEQYALMVSLSRSGVGLDEKEWRPLLDGYLEGKGCTPEQYYKMNASQQEVITEIKKSMTRRGVRNTKK